MSEENLKASDVVRVAHELFTETQKLYAGKSVCAVALSNMLMLDHIQVAFQDQIDEAASLMTMYQQFLETQK